MKILEMAFILHTDPHRVSAAVAAVAAVFSNVT